MLGTPCALLGAVGPVRVFALAEVVQRAPGESAVPDRGFFRAGAVEALGLDRLQGGLPPSMELFRRHPPFQRMKRRVPLRSDYLVGGFTSEAEWPSRTCLGGA